MSEKMDYLENSVREEVRQLVIVDRFSVDLKEKILALLDKVRQAQAEADAKIATDYETPNVATSCDIAHAIREKVRSGQSILETGKGKVRGPK